MERPKDIRTTGPDGGDEKHDENYDDGNPRAQAQDSQIIRNKLKEKIHKFRIERKKLQNRNIIAVKRAKNVFQAMHLPKILNLNPRSAMNKIQQISRFIEEEEIDVAFISESHDRENLRLEEEFKLDTHTVISNIHQRPSKEKGGRPAIIRPSRREAST